MGCALAGAFPIGALARGSVAVVDLAPVGVVVRVEGGYVAAAGEGEEGAAQDTIHVTLALDPQDAARVIQTVQTGQVWLTLSPEGAEKADIDAVIPNAPSRVTGVLE